MKPRKRQDLRGVEENLSATPQSFFREQHSDLSTEEGGAINQFVEP